MTCDGKDFVSFDVVFEPRLAGGHEGQLASELYPLRVDVFGTRQLTRVHTAECHTHQTVLIERAALTHSFSVSVHRPRTPARLFMPYYDGGAYQTPIETNDTAGAVSPSTSIVLKFYATSYTETRQMCWQTVGSAVLPLWQLAEYTGAARRELKVPVELHRDANVLVPIKRPLIKGQLVMSNVRISGITTHAPSTYDIDASLDRQQAATTKMYGVIDRGMLAFFGVRRLTSDSLSAFLGRSTKQFLRPFHVPTFVGDRMPLVSSAYAQLRPAGELSVPYYEQLLEIALERGNMSKAEAIRCGSAALHREGLRHERHAFGSLVVRTVTVFALSQCYMDDLINRNVDGTPWQQRNVENVEDFKVCRLCGADDCEGVALEVHMHVRELQSAPAHIVARMSVLLQMVRDFLRLYISTLALGAVTNKKLTATELNQRNVLAHTFATMIPFWDFYARSGSVARAALLNSRLFRERSAELRPFEHSDNEPCLFSPLVGEGTAPMDSAMKPVTFYYPADEHDADPTLRATALRAAALRRTLTTAVVSTLARRCEQNLTIEVFGAADTDDAASASSSDWSQFYKYPVSLAVADFADLRTFDWALVYNRDSEDERTFGIEFRDLLHNDRLLRSSSNSTDRKQPGIVPFLELSEDELRTSDAILLDHEPVPVLARAPDDYVDAHVRRFDRMLRLLTSRPAQPERGTVLHPRRTYMSMRACDIHPATIVALRAIARLPMVRGLEFKWWTLNAAVDGTQQHNTILDVYLYY